LKFDHWRVGANIIVLLLCLLFSHAALSEVVPPGVLLQQGMEHLREGELEKAIQKLQASVMMNPNDGRALYQLGLAYYNYGIKQQDPKLIGTAQTVWKSAIDLYKEGDHMKNTLQDIYNRAEAHKKQISKMIEVRKKLEVSPDSLEAGLEYAGLLYEYKQYSESDEMYRKLAKSYSNDPRPYTEWAAMVHEMGRIGWAKTYYKRALKIAPDYHPAKEGLKKITDELDGLRLEGYEAVFKASH
jgi:tetratricopeptide (TPR) repeat protein